MRTLWTHRDVEAPASTIWELLSDPERWPAWGPTVRRATLRSDRLEEGATGTVTTFVGLELEFEITRVEPGVSWAWNIAGVGATDHRVESLGAQSCRVSFGVPWPAAPYLVVGQQAVRQLDELASSTEAAR